MVKLNKEIYEQAKASFEWIGEKADSSQLSVSRSRPIPNSAKGYDYTEVDRVRFDGSTETNQSTYETSNIRTRIAACREAYANVGIIGNSIDLMIDFALEGMSIFHESKSIQRFYWQWANHVGLRDLAEQILKCYFRDSNVPILAFRGRITSGEIKKYKKVLSEYYDVEAKIKFFTDEKSDKKVIPYDYQVLDVMSLDKLGSDFLNAAIYEYQISTADWKLIKESNPTKTESDALAKLKEGLGAEAYNYLKKKGKLLIDPRRMSMLYYKKDSYKRWANPMLWRVIDDLKFKALLRDMDISVAESAINTITIIALGDTPNGFAPTAPMYAKMIDLLKTPSKSQTIVWNDLINIISEYPPVEKILGKEKYEQVDGDIRAGLGIAEVLINGAGGNYSNSFLGVRTLLERLQCARNDLLDWINGEFDKVAVAMGFKKPAVVKLHQMNLSDQEAEKKMILELVDRGMVSYQTCIEHFGENFDIEVQRMKDEDKFRRKNEKKFPYVLAKAGKFGPMMSSGPVPFIGLLDAETLDMRQTQDAKIIRQKQKVELDHLKNPPQQDGAIPPKSGDKKVVKKKKMPTAQEEQGKKGGRPIKTGKKLKQKDTPRTKPKGQSTATCVNPAMITKIKITESDYIVGLNIYNVLYNSLAKAALKNRDGLSDLDEERLSDVITDIIGAFNDSQEITAKKIQNLIITSRDKTTAPATLDRCVKRVKEKLVSEYKKKHGGKAPGKDKMKDIVSSAWAICKKSLGQ